MEFIYSLAEIVKDEKVHALWPVSEVNDLKPMTVEQPENPLRQPHRLISNISAPELIECVPEVSNGKAVLIIPGGGYQFVSIDNEGIEVGRCLAKMGYHAFCLNYRLPDCTPKNQDIASIQDAQQALHVVKTLCIGHEVGVLGFSAGGHLAAWLSTLPVSDKPKFVCLMYPVVSMNLDITHLGSYQTLKSELNDPTLISELSIEHRITSDTPPMLIMHAKDDLSVVPEHSQRLHSALNEHGVSSKLELFEQGGHGFGAYVNEAHDARNWLDRFHAWISSQ
ncbi:alpha/beta hydrolase [Vibrio hangzhouensis]|uniref:alpha/beta hydrolase n=1 Tax=Vibrio hangzhouensis TaxID=462991 RepID=UPI001C9854D8|nr:alpha/beta hydrolase [Vibrio hangzhouensis]MBY6195703.1 alpha/beta hydrolase [Vibrio hangzhouensis]